MKFKETLDTDKYVTASEPQYKLSAIQRVLVCLTISFTVLGMFFKEAIFGVLTLIKGRKVHTVKNQLCLVTGGANGLGREIAMRFAKEGCDIAIADIINTDNAVEEIIQIYGVQCKGFNCDVSDMKSVEKLRSDIEASMRPVDILVNNAGLLFMGLLLKTPIEQIEKCINVNLTSHFKVISIDQSEVANDVITFFQTLKTFLPGMIERKRGRIVAIASLSAKVSPVYATTYTSTKYGIHGLMESLYDDLCVYDLDEFIKLTTIFPNFINTRKELGDVLDALEFPVPRLTPQYTADVIVKGTIENKRNIVISPTPASSIIQ
jgi:all-trans-retinol dehydrogenase (NAD+)